MAVTKKIKQGEGKTLKFTVTDADGTVVNITSATLTYTLKRKKSDSTALIEKTDSDFDKTDAASGIAKVSLSQTDTDLSVRIYVSELKVYFNATMVEKSQDIYINVEEAVE